MTNATTNAAPADTTATTTNAAPAAPAAPKAPSKKSQALVIFNEQMALRAAGKFASNKEFRATVLSRIVTELEVTIASASTMYNAAKKEAEAVDETVALGRDPKKEKVKSATGKRGRPVGSKNKAKKTADAAAPAADAAAPTVVTVNVDAPVAPAAGAEPALM
jgi:hypothetical protein